MSQQPRTSQGRSTVAYIRGVVLTLVSDPADRADAERCLREIEKRVRLVEEAAVDAAYGPEPERAPVTARS